MELPGDESLCDVPHGFHVPGQSEGKDLEESAIDVEHYRTRRQVHQDPSQNKLGSFESSEYFYLAFKFLRWVVLVLPVLYVFLSSRILFEPESIVLTYIY